MAFPGDIKNVVLVFQPQVNGKSIINYGKQTEGAPFGVLPKQKQVQLPDDLAASITAWLEAQIGSG